MEIQITRKKVIYSIITVVLCISFFCIGRFVRFRGVSGTGDKLIEGIVLSRDTADQIFDILNIAESAISSSDEYSKAIIRGIAELQQSNAVGKLCLDEIKRTIEDSERFTEEFSKSYSDFSSATDRAFSLAIGQSMQYERIINSLRQFTDDIAENCEESE